jgi:hypothetical protein
MRRAREERSEDSSEEEDAAAVAAACKLVAPLLQLQHAASDAVCHLRFARCLELSERTLAAAEALLPLPRDSLVIAFCMSSVLDARVRLREDVVAAAETPQLSALLKTVWRDDKRALSLAQRRLALYHARWRAGTLFTLSLEERAFFAGCNLSVRTSGDGYIFCRRARRRKCVAAAAHTRRGGGARARRARRAADGAGNGCARRLAALGTESPFLCCASC